MIGVFASVERGIVSRNLVERLHRVRIIAFAAYSLPARPLFAGEKTV